jgi:hypothetical protein
MKLVKLCKLKSNFGQTWGQTRVQPWKRPKSDPSWGFCDSAKKPPHLQQNSGQTFNFSWKSRQKGSTQVQLRFARVRVKPYFYTNLWTTQYIRNGLPLHPPTPATPDTTGWTARVPSKKVFSKGKPMLPNVNWTWSALFWKSNESHKLLKGFTSSLWGFLKCWQNLESCPSIWTSFLISVLNGRVSRTSQASDLSSRHWSVNHFPF